jgi:hypothetical protein
MAAFVLSAKLPELMSYRMSLTVPQPARASVKATPDNLFIGSLEMNCGTPFTAGTGASPDAKALHAEMKNGSRNRPFPTYTLAQTRKLFV